MFHRKGFKRLKVFTLEKKYRASIYLSKRNAVEKVILFYVPVMFISRTEGINEL